MQPTSQTGTEAAAPSTILVPLDGSIQATAALPVAKGLADLEEATLRMIHVGTRHFPPHEVLRNLNLTPEQLAGSVLDQLSGPAGVGIVDQAREQRSRAIVMCVHTGMDKPKGALGSIAREVLLNAACPVVLVQPERGLLPWRLRHVLVPHDGTPTSSAAVGHAADLARRGQAELIVLHVATECCPGETGTFAAPRYLDQPQHEWSTWAQEFLRRAQVLGEAPSGVPMRVFLARGEAGQAIVDFATRGNSDLIALAWRGVLEPDRAATAQMVLKHAPCPIIIYRVAPPASEVPEASLGPARGW